MKKINISLALFAALSFLSSCEDKMDYNEYAVYEKSYVIEDFSTVGGFLTELYNAVDYDFGNYSGGAFRGSSTDESVYSSNGNAIEDYYNGSWSPTNAKSGEWSRYYTAISLANHFLAEFQGLKFEELKHNDDYAAQMQRYENYPNEVRFLRAYYYFALVRQYGGVPLIDRVMSVEDMNTVKRSSSDEIFEFIIRECQDIQDKIIANYADLGEFALAVSENGRANKMSVLALKARAALYWASPLFNPSGDKERYRNAALYAKEVLDQASASGRALTPKYQDLWSNNAHLNPNISKEILFAMRDYGSANGDHAAESNNYPVGIEGAKASNCPTQNLVDAYDMTNGKDINDPASGYDPQDPYKNRDPRLALTVAVNGDVWPTYQKEKLQTYVGGLNGLPLTNATPTGYYLKKLCNGAISLAGDGKVKNSFHTYLTFRLGEFYLDYAEAMYQLTGSADATEGTLTMSAREAASKTRERVKMPALEGDGEIFWRNLQKERQVELAFEGHRFWDVRRWKDADKYFTNIERMEITMNPDGTFTYTRKSESRPWNDRWYLFPIPQSERAKNPNLDQNPGW